MIWMQQKPGSINLVPLRQAVYKSGGLEQFHKHEQDKLTTPHNAGLLADLFTKLSFMQKLEEKAKEQAKEQDPEYKPILRTAIITARNAPAHERMVTTLESWGVWANETFFLGGMEKGRILRVFKPHIFFDDQKDHLKPSEDNIPMVHIPFGVANKLEIK